MTTASISLIFPLADANKSRRAGGKATNLSKLVAARFAVPRGFVLSADAYRSHLWASGTRTAASAQVDAEQREAIREAILSHPIPDDVWRFVAEAYERLSWQTGLPEPKVAVRSSALEDGGEAGFSGAYESYLNVSGLEALDIAIKRVWASLWSGKAAAYRARHGCSIEPAMAVIVQQMVEADSTGTAYTANPVTGDPQSVSVAVRGDGAPAQYAVGLRDLSVMKAIDSADVDTDESTVRMIAEQSILIEDVIGGTVEVEWAVDRDGIWILQAGSIIDLPAHFPTEWENQADGQVLWTRDDARPISYLARDLTAGGSEQRVLNGYLYTRRSMPLETKDRRGAARARAKEIDEASESLREWQKHACQEIRERIKDLSELKAAEMDHSALLRAIGSSAEAIRASYEWLRRGQRMVPRLSEMLLELLQERSLVWRLLGGVPDAVFERDALLQEMAERFAMAEQSGKLDDEKWWRGYRTGVERFALAHGYAFKDPGETADPSRWRSWIADTNPVFRMIGAISKKGGGTTLVTRHCAAEQDSNAAQTDVAKLVSGKQTDIKRLVELGRGWIGARAEAERQCALAGAMLRLAVDALAGKLECAGAISSTGDVFLLSVAELVAMPEQPDAEQRSELAAKIALRKHDAWMERRLVAPKTLPINDSVDTSEHDGIAGLPASAGEVSGHARIVATVEDAAEIEKGDILIVAASSNVWTPFFAVAGGFVCEAGDDTSPEAIAARSYGIPAVMNCAAVTRLIRDGQKITLNGTSGTLAL